MRPATPRQLHWLTRGWLVGAQPLAGAAAMFWMPSIPRPAHCGSLPAPAWQMVFSGSVLRESTANDMLTDGDQGGYPAAQRVWPTWQPGYQPGLRV